MKKRFRYFASYVEPGEPIREFSRVEMLDRLQGWVIDTELAVRLLEESPEERQRLTAFAFYWAEEVAA